MMEIAGSSCDAAGKSTDKTPKFRSIYSLFIIYILFKTILQVTNQLGLTFTWIYIIVLFKREIGFM
jgi:hypothetical protein